MGKVSDEARTIAEKLCAERGLMLWDVRFENLGGTPTLTVFIDRESGANIDDCEDFSRALEPLLDERDAIAGSWSLEVSTPGMERKLERAEHFAFCLGERVEIKFYKPLDDGRKTIFGELKAYAGGEKPAVTVLEEESGEEMTFSAGDCSRIRLSPDFSVYF